VPVLHCCSSVFIEGSVALTTPATFFTPFSLLNRTEIQPQINKMAAPYDQTQPQYTQPQYSQHPPAQAPGAPAPQYHQDPAIQPQAPLAPHDAHNAAPATVPGAGGAYVAPHAAGTTHAGTIDHNDMNDWKARFNSALNDPNGTIKAKAPAEARKWEHSFWGCCVPVSTCFISCCLPCITFGKTHHRTRKSPTLEGYSAINTSCLLFCGASCFGLHWIPEAMQRADIRHKYNLQGSFVGDIIRSFCCPCCELMQTAKEAEFREKELAGGVNVGGESAQYGSGNEKMEYQAPVPSAPAA